MPCCTLAGSSPVATPNRLLKASTRLPLSAGTLAANIEIRQIRGLDLQHGQFQPRIGAQQLGLELAAVVERDGDVVGVEHVAPHGQDVALGEIRKPL